MDFSSTIPFPMLTYVYAAPECGNASYGFSQKSDDKSFCAQMCEILARSNHANFFFKNRLDRFSSESLCFIDRISSHRCIIMHENILKSKIGLPDLPVFYRGSCVIGRKSQIDMSHIVHQIRIPSNFLPVYQLHAHKKYF